MTPEELLETMRSVLAEEKAAILRFDARGITRANEAKQAVLRRLQAAAVEHRPALYAALDELKPALQCNLILLAHAGAYIRDTQQEIERDAPASEIPLVIRKSA